MGFRTILQQDILKHKFDKRYAPERVWSLRRWSQFKLTDKSEACRISSLENRMGNKKCLLFWLKNQNASQIYDVSMRIRSI